MQTHFSILQLADPKIKEADNILRSCVHCGLCTATCPTFVLLGDELDSPRGRIYLIKDMLENDRIPSSGVIKHLDRCLSCLSCMTTCPSSVHYMHLIDYARVLIEKNGVRSLYDRFMRFLLSSILPRPNLFRVAILLSWMIKPFKPIINKVLDSRFQSILNLVPNQIWPPSQLDRPQVFKAKGRTRARVALLTGCAQKVLSPEINEATVRLLNRHGVEVVITHGMGCCGALTHHMGKERQSLVLAKANIDAWIKEATTGGLDAVVVNTSGCGTTLKDYTWMFRNDPVYAEKADYISKKTLDIAELMLELGLQKPTLQLGEMVTYHSPCSMQHGQKIKNAPQILLKKAGFSVSEVPEGHLCCGSAGTYNILQPEIANRLKQRKLFNIANTYPDIVATGNIGCITQLSDSAGVPVLHTVELLDWATGGPRPKGLD